jgi:hypothetical protein
VWEGRADGDDAQSLRLAGDVPLHLDIVALVTHLSLHKFLTIHYLSLTYLSYSTTVTVWFGLGPVGLVVYTLLVVLDVGVAGLDGHGDGSCSVL